MTEYLPDFLGIGAVKAGTTWLHQNLYKHPELYLPITKPVRYFDRHRDKPIESYKGLFRPGAERVRGEISASYSVLPVATIRYIHELMPQAKLIFLMREPKARAWSEAKMEFSLVRGLADKPISEDEYCDFIGSEQCRSRSDYRAILANWRGVFPKSQIFIGLIDDIREQPKELLMRIFDFLGVSSAIDGADYPLKEKVFEGLAIKMPDRCRQLLDSMHGRDEISALGDLVGINLVHRWGYE